jgi:hypothetical protein
MDIDVPKREIVLLYPHVLADVYYYLVVITIRVSSIKYVGRLSSLLECAHSTEETCRLGGREWKLIGRVTVLCCSAGFVTGMRTEQRVNLDFSLWNLQENSGVNEETVGCIGRHAIHREREKEKWSSRNLEQCWSWRIAFSGMLRHVALVRTDVSEELSASFIRVTRIG